ncbi:hypothetical protein FUA23_00350 [Neolewinella aurantiaca]|uniref:Tetratricopeptide repeat protein n=1 Tax=Neolewinella aurantiaca TaxID=2602767 RepID=A0A5C7FJZ9_9BACT|nr:hypothetical protein [Neolewinella aurantiaca]TXF91668.1 hypothetical protein FUA23_00350 [Neolewinella aurantiaca]
MDTPSLFQKLWSRKVPQYLGTYLAVGFGFLQFLEFISRRFDLSDFWVDAYLLLWLCLLPAVSLLIYYRGLPQGGKGKHWKTGMIIVNVVLGLLLLAFIPDHSDSLVATETVTAIDEAGTPTQRTIPSATTVQRIAVFEFLNDKDDEASGWWGTAYSLLLTDILHQRPEILVKNVRSLNRYYSLYEVPLFSRINLATQRKIAERANTDYFVRAEYKASEDNYEISGSLYRTSDGKEVKHLGTATDDPFVAIDNIKDQIFDFLPPPVVSDDVVTNLPASALITDNVRALEFFAKGNIAFSTNPGDLPPSVAHFRKSVEADPSCAPCLYELADKLYGLGKTDSALTMITKATKLAEVLPEREQFGYKRVLLNISGQYENSIRLTEYANKLYPYEYWPYSGLVGYCETNYGVDSAIVLMNKAAMLSDREAALNKLYGLYMKSDQFEEAEEVIRQLDEKYANKEETQRRYAGYYFRTGQMDKARSVLQDMMATDPTNLELSTQLAEMEINAGYYENAGRIIKDVFKRATNRADSTQAWNYRVRISANSGRIRDALNDLEAYEKFISQEAPVNVILLQDYNTKMDYASRLEDPDPFIERINRQIAPYRSEYLEAYECYALILRVMRGGKPDGVEDALASCHDLLAGMGNSAVELEHIANLIAEENYSAVADMIDNRLENGTEILQPEVYIRIQRLAGRMDRAGELLDAQLRVMPNDPGLLLEKVKLLVAQANMEEAKAPLQSVLSTWKDADEDFYPLQEAKTLAEKLNLSPAS